MTSIRNKVPVALPGSNIKKKDVHEGNTDVVQIKEEPADMEEYLKSSNTVIQAHGKMRVAATSSSTGSSSNQVQLATPGKTPSASAPSPVATSKPAVGPITRSQAQNLASVTASKAVPSMNAAKMPTSEVKDIGCSLTALQKTATPASSANGKPALGNLRSTAVLTNAKGTVPPRNSPSVGVAKSGVAISTVASVVSADPKARPTLKQDTLAVNNPSKAPVTIVTQKDCGPTQVKTGSVTLLTNSKVLSAMASSKAALLPGNPKTPAAAAARDAVLQNKAKDAKAMTCPPTLAPSSHTAGKQLQIDAVPSVMSASESVSQDQPVSGQKTSQGAVAEIDPVAAPCPDAFSWSDQNAGEYAGSYESGFSDIRGALTLQDEATPKNSSERDENCTEKDLEITIKVEPSDDLPDNTSAHVAGKELGNSIVDRSGKQIVCAPHPVVQIQTVLAGITEEAATSGHDTISVISGVSSSATSVGHSVVVVAKTGSSVLDGSETGCSKPMLSPRVASAVCFESKADASESSNKNKSSASAAAKGSLAATKTSVAPTKTLPAAAVKTLSIAATKTSAAATSISSATVTSLAAVTKTPSAAVTKTSSAATEIVSLPESGLDLSIVKTEPMDVGDAPVSSEVVPGSVDETANAEPSSRETLADTPQSTDSAAAAEQHAVPVSSASSEDAEEQVSLTTSEHPSSDTQVVVRFATTQPDTSDHSMSQVDSRTCDYLNEASLEMATIEAHAEEELSVSNQQRDDLSEQDSGVFKTTLIGSKTSTENISCAEPNFTTGTIAELTDNDEDMANTPNANVNYSPTASRHDASMTTDHDDAFLSFSGVSDIIVPSGDLSMKNQASGLLAQTTKPLEMRLRELNGVEDAMCRSNLETSSMGCVVGSAKKVHQTTMQALLPTENSKDKQLVHSFLGAADTTSTTASGGAQFEEETVKRVIRLSKQDKSKRLAGDKSENASVAPPAKRSRLMTPVSGKENVGLAGIQSQSDRKKSSGHRTTRKKNLTPCASRHPSVERKHLKKNPIGKVSDDLWMETSSFLDEDLRSELECSEPVYIFEPRNHKQRTDLRMAEKGKLYLNSKSGKSFVNQTKRGRVSRKELNMRFRSARQIRFPFLSQFVKRSADRCCWDLASCQVEDISAALRQDLLSDLNSVYLGRQPRFLLKPMGHLDGLSLETQLESQLLDFHSVRVIFLEVARDWVRNKPLHLLMTGQLKMEPHTYMPPKRMSRTNATFENCQKAFCRDICYILADICNLGESDDSLFALPDGVSQFTANRVFRKVKQYLRNYVDRLLRTVVADRDTTNYAQLYYEGDRRKFRARGKAKHSLKESRLLQVPVSEKVVPLEEPVDQETDDARINDPALVDSAMHRKVLPGPSKRLSAELSLPVQNSLNAAFDLFSKEAENICQGTIETRVVVGGGVVDGEACTVVDSSKLYSPTRPTDIEELEIGVLENMEAAEVVTAVAVSKETGLDDEACNVISVEVLEKPISMEKIVVVEKAVTPKIAQLKETEDGEIEENVVNQEKSSSSSVVEDRFHQKRLRSLVARRTVESARVPSTKRKKRTKTSREKKTKKKKDKRKSESHPSGLEKDRGHRRKKFKYSEEDRVESRRQVASPEIVKVTEPEPARVCLATESDPVYFDSYTSVVEDVLSSVPLSNFEENFDPLCPSSEHYRNPYRFSWPLIEYFVNRNVDVLSQLVGVIPNVNAFTTRLVKRGNSFLWSLILALFDATTQIQTDAKIPSETEEMSQNALHQKFKSVSDLMELGNMGEDGAKKLSVKGNNPLMQAFRQVVEAKRRLSREANKAKPFSSITKLSAELAALRAAPKSAKPLFKPMSNTEAQNTFKISGSNASRVQDTVERSAQLASEALFQLYMEMKVLLNEQEDTDLTEASDLPRIELPTAGSHLGGLSSLVFSLYENYERLNKISEETDFSQPAGEMDECITIDDDLDSLPGDKIDEASNDVNVDLQAGDVKLCVDDAEDLDRVAAAEKMGQNSFDLSDEEVHLSPSAEIHVSKEVVSTAGPTTSLRAEKEAAKVRDMEEVGLSTGPAIPAPNDRQYISSFPPINAIKKKPKASSQAPRMIFSKLIGPSLEERLGSASSITSPSAPVMPQPPVSTQQPSSVITTSSLVVSSPVTLILEVSAGIDQAQDVRVTNESSVAHAASLSMLIGKIDSLPSRSPHTLPCDNSSQNDAPANVKTLVKSKATLSAEQQKFTLSPATSNVASTAQGSAIVSTTAVSSLTTAPSQSSAAVAAPVVAAGSQVSVPSFDESSYSATFPPIPPENPSSENSVVLPPLPFGEADMLPPPLPPMTLSEMASSGSNTLAPTSSSAYYSGYFSSVSSSSGYDAYGSYDPTQSLVSSWMYDQNMYPTSNQAPILDPSLMAYPPPLQSDPMSFYLQPTNQPPPFLPAAPGSQVFPTYPSSQSVAPSSLPYMQTPGQLPGTFSYPPPNLPPPTIPPPNIPPPTIPHPSIPPPSIPPPSIFPSAAPFPTSMPPPAVMPYNMYGSQWNPDVSSHSNQFMPSDYYPQTSASLATMPSSSPSVSVPPPVLDGQQGSLHPESLSSIHDMVKYPPPAMPGSTMPNSSIPESQAHNTKPDHQTDVSSEKDQSVQYSSQLSEAFNYAAPSFKNNSQDTYPAVSSSGEQSQESKMNDNESYVEPASLTSSRKLSSSELEKGLSSDNQPWDSTSLPHHGASGSWESMNKDGWPSQSPQPVAEQGTSGQQQRPKDPLLQQPKEASMNSQQRKPQPQDQDQMQDSLQRQSGHQEQPLSQIRQQGASGLDQRLPVSRHLLPGSEPSRPGPRLRQSGPLLRQPDPESRQPVPELRQPVPESRQPAPRLRQPVPESRQPGPCLRQPVPESRQPGPRLRQPVPESRQPVPHLRQPGPESRQSGPRLRQPVPESRQPVPESRQPGPPLRQPGPESRQLVPLLRQPVPEPRQPGSLLRQPGPLLRHLGPEQKQPGQPLRQPGTTEQRQEGPQHRQGLQLRQSNPAGQEQMLLGPQSRPNGPRQRLEGPDQGQSGSHDTDLRLFGPQAARSVAPLMTASIRRSIEGAASQSAKHDRPGHGTPPQGPLSNTRFFVFNTDRSACATAEHLLLCSGAQKFDPYNINALRVMPEIRCLLLVHKEDLKHVQRIPSLLRLKRDLRVSFVMFGDASDIQQKRLVAFFPRAGTMVMDLTALLACKSDVLDGMCQFMTQQTVEKRTSWKLMLPSNVFNAIDFLKYKYEDEPEEHVRLAEVSQILATYKTSGIVEFLPENPYRGQPRTTVEYQASCVALQISRLGSYRHFLFVSDMPRNHPDANLFLNNGIDILSIPEFMRCFVSRQVEHQPKLHPPYITRVTMNRYHDAVISNGTECIAI